MHKFVCEVFDRVPQFFQGMAGLRSNGMRNLASPALFTFDVSNSRIGCFIRMGLETEVMTRFIPINDLCSWLKKTQTMHHSTGDAWSSEPRNGIPEML